MQTKQTHWTRVFYYDYFTRSAGEAARSHEEPMEEPKTLSASIRRSPLRAAAVLLCIYVAMYLAVGGALYMVRGPEASAATQPHSAVAAIAWDVCS